MNTDRLQLIFFIAIFIGISILAAFVFLPFAKVLVTALILAVVMQPLYAKVLPKVGNKRSVAAGLVVIAVAGVLISLLFMLGTNIFQESKDLYVKLTSGSDNFLTVVTDLIEKPVQRFFPEVSLDIKSHVDQAVGFIGSYAGTILSATATTILYIFLGIVAFFYFLRDGKEFKEQLVAISPLKDEFDVHIFHKMKEAINVVVKGTLMIALVQGMLVGIGFAIFGVPNATLWGSLAVICAIIPGVGTSIVLLPGIAYLGIQDMTGMMIGLAIWGAIMVGLIDNILAPMVYGKGVNIHPLIILFSVLGGIAFFGPIGFLFGPLAITLLFVLLHMYRIIILRSHKEPLE